MIVWQIKRESQAFYCAIQLIEYSDNIPLTDREWDDPHFQELLLWYNDTGILANDIGSFEKEWHEENRILGNMYSVVALIALLEKVSIDAAMQKTVKTLADYERKTMELFEKYTSDGTFTANQKKICERIQYMMGGNYYGSIVLFRYNMSNVPTRH